MPRLTEERRKNAWFIAGPTATGKSDVALALVDRLRASGQSPEIIAMDSMTLYRGMDIGTAKPSDEDRNVVPHHLFDILDIDQTYSVAEYVGDAQRVADEIAKRNGTPVFVGGTGLYLRSLLRGVFAGPPADPSIRERLKSDWTAAGPHALHTRLSTIDPRTASRVAVNDCRRIVRALEVFELTGQPLSAWQSEEEVDSVASRVYWLEPDRSELHRRINLRVDRMLEAGWLDEAKALLQSPKKIGPTARQALGYQELFGVIENNDDLEQVVERIKARTRQFAKRQHTWFRNLEECRAVPVDIDETAESVATRILEYAAR